MTFPRPTPSMALALAVLGFAAPARAQWVIQPARPAAPTYRPAAPRAYVPAGPARFRRGATGLPYNRSPYTDDWSTSRHLPYPKPWMLPTRDPAFRGR